jgi:hypothetical protein
LLWEAEYGDRKKNFRFKFKKWWLQYDDELGKIVESIWKNAIDEKKAIDRWQNRVRMFRKKAKGWSANLELEIRRQKKKLENEYDKLDREVDFRDLTKKEKDRHEQVAKEINKILEMKEIKAKQRAREKHIKRGG